MALTYTWAITSLKKTTDVTLDLDNVVVQTTWTCTGTDSADPMIVFVLGTGLRTRSLSCLSAPLMVRCGQAVA